MHFNDWFRIDSGRKNCGGDRLTVFSTAVDPMNKNWLEQEELDLTKPRLAVYKQAWKVSQDAVYWVDICRAQRMGSKFFQTRSKAIILYDTLPPICFEKVVSRKTEEVLFFDQSFEVATSCTDDYLIGKKMGILMHQFTMRRQRERVCKV